MAYSPLAHLHAVPRSRGVEQEITISGGVWWAAMVVVRSFWHVDVALLRGAFFRFCFHFYPAPSAARPSCRREA